MKPLNYATPSLLQHVVSALGNGMPERIAPNMIRVYRVFTHLPNGYIVPHEDAYATQLDGLEALQALADEYGDTTFALYDESIYLH